MVRRRGMAGAWAGWLRAALLGVGLLALAPLAGATTPEAWNTGLYGYKDDSASLGDVLAGFAHAMGVSLRVAEEVPLRQKWIGGEQPDASTPLAFLNRLAAGHSLQYFVFNGVLYVSLTSRLTMEHIDLDAGSAESAKETLTGLGLFEPRFGWGGADGDDGGGAVVSGPAAYIRLVRQVLAKAAADDKRKEPALMVFRLKHATADDAQIEVRGKTRRQPGVASVMRAMLGLHGAPASAAPALEPALDALPAALDGRGLGAPKPTGRAAANDTRDLNRRQPYPSVEAYAPLNAVLVRDLPERRAVYTGLIDALDVESHQIEIRAEIIDVDVDSLEEWSAQLSYQSSAVSAGIGLPATSAAAGSATLSLWAANRLNIGLQSLASKGSARVLARPSILTLDNETAVLDLSQTATFRLVGERAVDLKEVTVGTLLQVTPRLLGDDARSPIQLSIQLEDGAFGTTAVADGPLVTQGAVHTSAVVRPGQALVIGGYRRRELDRKDSHVPGLSQIPLIGRLFQADSDTDTTHERLLVITAQVLADDAGLPATEPPEALQQRFRTMLTVDPLFH